MWSQSYGMITPGTWSVAINGIRSWSTLGHTELQVLVVNLDEQQEKLLNIALTKVSGDRDEEALKTCIKPILVKWIADI